MRVRTHGDEFAAELAVEFYEVGVRKSAAVVLAQPRSVHFERYAFMYYLSEHGLKLLAPFFKDVYYGFPAVAVEIAVRVGYVRQSVETAPVDHFVHFGEIQFP